CIDDGFCGQAMSYGIQARALLSLFGQRSRAELRVAAVGLDLPDRGHPASGLGIGFVSSFLAPLARRPPLNFIVSSAAMPAEAGPTAWVLAQRAVATGNGSTP